MGVSHSRTIYDPQERNLDLKTYAKEHNTIISEWKRDSNGRLICYERIDILFYQMHNFKELYNKLNKLGLKGIDNEGNIYEFSEKW
jgi:hypothetical protein